jgi:tetratricopeptide (TPR) repeat protein
MRTSATVGLFLLLFAAAASAQSESSPRYAMAGLVVVPDVLNHSQMEVRLVSEIEIPVGRVLLYPQERFVFSNLAPGRYYLLMNVPGYKPVRQRVDASGFDAGISASIFLEPLVELKAPKPLHLNGDADLVDATEFTRQGKVLKYLEAAEKKLRKGAVSDARSRLESIVRDMPDSYDAHRLLASAYQQSRRYAEAAKEYQAAQTLRPRSAAPLIGLGSLYLEQIENGAETPDAARSILDEAKKVLVRAVQVSPDAAFAHYLLGVAYFKNAIHIEAERSFRRSLELEPRLIDAHLGLSNVYTRRGNWAAALTELNNYLKQAPHSAAHEQALRQRARVEKIASGEMAETAQR